MNKTKILICFFFIFGLTTYALFASGADFKKPLKEKQARPGSCCTVNYGTDEGFPGVALRQICFKKNSTTLIIYHSTGNNICYHPSHLHLKEDNGTEHSARSIRGAEYCQEGKTRYKTQKRTWIVFPAVRRGLKSFSVWEDDATPPASFQNFHWSNISLEKCYKGQ